MINLPSIHRVAIASLLVVMIGAAAAAQSGGTRVNLDAATLKDFNQRVADYAALHKKLESTLPKLADDATPQQIDQNQRALERLVAEARANAKPGDIFTPAMQKFVRALFAREFKGRKGQLAKDQIHDEPHPVTPDINKRYPDVVPLATMPPSVLAELPKLPDELEYRFVADHLILMDVHAHVILDYVLNAMPATPARR